MLRTSAFAETKYYDSKGRNGKVVIFIFFGGHGSSRSFDPSQYAHRIRRLTRVDTQHSGVRVTSYGSKRNVSRKIARSVRAMTHGEGRAMNAVRTTCSGVISPSPALSYPAWEAWSRTSSDATRLPALRLRSHSTNEFAGTGYRSRRYAGLHLGLIPALAFQSRANLNLSRCVTLIAFASRDNY